MPFGLTNAQASFQDLMNSIFKPYLSKFILVFFNDILIYIPTMEEQFKHLQIAFEVLKQNQLYIKLFKCSFGQPSLEYLGRIISANGVGADSSKVKAMLELPQPKNVKSLRDFLGLTGYYRKFVRNYGIISRPLTQLLKKKQFNWTEETTVAFQQLKMAMTTTPVLTLPDFSQPFVVETDASQEGMGAVFIQNQRPLAFISKAFPPRKKGLSAYERELWAFIHAVQKWRTYLFGNQFIIKTDHQSLKYLLE